MNPSDFLNLRGPVKNSKDPLDGKTLEALLTELVTHFGWQKLGNLIPINCFNHEPSIPSSLTFLRRTPWARSKLEQLYVETFTNFLNYRQPD